MHGLINTAVQHFLGDAFGPAVWRACLHRAGLAEVVGPDGFEPLVIYDDAVTQALLAAAAVETARPVDSLLEDLGTYLVSHPRTEGLRRLLRFGGDSFVDFLRSLDDLRGRSRLAVPDLDLPDLRLLDLGEGRFLLRACDAPPGYGLVLVGALRALADDYGTLAVLEHRLAECGCGAERGPDGGEAVWIEVHDAAFHAGRPFALATAGAGG